MPYKDPAARAAYNREYYLRNKEGWNDGRDMSAWRAANPERAAYIDQRSKAKHRGIDWEITFQEWTGWWGDDFSKRGKNLGDLQMCRLNDEGPYRLDNIYKDTISGNRAATTGVKRGPYAKGTNEIEAPVGQ